MTESSLSYEDILNALAEQVGLDAQELLTTQELVVDGQPIGLQLEGDERNGDLIFFASLATPAPDQLQRVIRTLLEANHLWIGTGGCTLGLQPGTGAVTLCGRIRLDELGGKTLAALLDGFAETAGFWRNLIESPPELHQPVSMRGGASSHDLRA
jgi:hypothetical protein